MSPFFEVIVRSVVAFVLILIIARILGKHTVAQMTYHDFVSSISLGAITGNIAFNTSMKPWLLVSALVVFSGIAFVAAHLSMKSRKMRKWLSGKPTIVIEKGKILEHNLRKVKFTLDTLNQELREKEIFDIDEVEYAVLELNGKLSVLKKPEFRYLTKKDLAVSVPASNQFPVELIMDGKVVADNLSRSGIALNWLSKQLEQRGLAVEQVCYAVRGTSGGLYFDLYEDRIKHPINSE